MSAVRDGVVGESVGDRLGDDVVGDRVDDVGNGATGEGVVSVGPLAVT